MIVYPTFDVFRTLSHPNIVQFFGIHIDGKNTYLVTEYLDQGNLSELFAKARTADKRFGTTEFTQMYEATVVK